MSKSTSIEPDASTLAYQLYVELEWENQGITGTGHARMGVLV